MEILLSGGDFGGQPYIINTTIEKGQTVTIENSVYRYEGDFAVFIGYVIQD